MAAYNDQINELFTQNLIDQVLRDNLLGIKRLGALTPNTVQSSIFNRHPEPISNTRKKAMHDVQAKIDSGEEVLNVTKEVDFRVEIMKSGANEEFMRRVRVSIDESRKSPF